ncbi:hypothetical protein E4T52_04091 [Aureobasidium sp. EXF-3400]|nr:hypothetical protein E4T51_06640 [Aureobasidium sp. EXF-12344]KAI4781022.1 hypothetical protein E4T52_04091 [Aureobasidium sp. EXF-3400]
MLFENVKSKYPEAGALLIFLAILGTWKIPTTFLNQYQRFLPEIQSEDDQESQHLVEALSTPEALQFALSHLANACLVKQDSDRDHPYRSNTLHRAIRDWSLRTLLQGKQVWLLQATRGLVAATLNYDEQTTPSLDTLQQRRTLDRAFLAPLKRCVALVHRKVPANQTLPPFGRYCRQYAELVVKLAEINLSCGLLAEADRDFTVAIEYRRTTGVAEWPKSQVDLMLLEGLAVVRYRSADFDSCIEILETALRLAEDLYGQFDPEVAAITSYSKEVSEKLERMQQHHKRVVLAGSSTGTAKAGTPGRGMRVGTPDPPSYEEQQTVLGKRQIEENHQLNADLRAAAYAGLTEKVVFLLSIEGVDPNSTEETGLTALSLAIFRKHFDIVHLLLDFDRINVNVKGVGGETVLCLLVGRGEMVEKLLQKGADVNMQGGYHANALQAASAEGRDKVVQMLLEHDANVNAQGGHYGNALQAAATEGHVKVVQMLLEREADFNAQGGHYGNALQAASAKGRNEVVQMLLECNADVNSQGGPYGSALQAASAKGHDKIVRMLLERNADVSAQGGYSGSAPGAAAKNGHDKIVQMLFDHDVDVNAQSGFYGRALREACEFGHDKIVQMLLDRNTDVDDQSIQYRGYALQAASASGHDKIVQMLLDRNADVIVQSGQYESSLKAAIEWGHDKIVQMLLDKGAHLTAESLFHFYLYKRTPISPSWSSHIQVEMVAERDQHASEKILLHWGAECGDQTVTKHCLDLGAGVNTTDMLGRTALHYAAGSGHSEVVKTLIQANADITILDNCGRTALHFAAEHGHIEIVKTLVQANADITIFDNFGCTALDCVDADANPNSYLAMVAYLWGPQCTIGATYSNAISSTSRADTS